MKTLKQFCRENGVKISCQWANSNPNMDDFEGKHYKVTLKMNGREMTLPFSQGYAHTEEPKAVDVMSCLISDSDVDNYDFEEWAANLGYDTDSRKAEKTYIACKRQTEKFKRFVGNKFDELLYNVDPY